MEHFYLEAPSNNRKDEIIDYIDELITYKSDINGIEVLSKILDGHSFENVLDYCLKIEKKEYAKKIGNAQVKTLLLVRKEDNRIVGALNIRWNYPKITNRFIGNIGYGIRPTERRKGYNKINLYLGLIEAEKIGLNIVKLVCETSNLGSTNTIKALGGILQEKSIDPSDGILTSIYYIYVNEAIKNNYESFRNFLIL